MADIVYRFTATGQDSVERAFTSIENAAKRNAKMVETLYAGQAAAARRASATVEREARRPISRLEQLAKEVARDQERAAQREARSKAQALQYVARIRERHFADEQRQRERAAVAGVRSEQRASRDRQVLIARESKLREKLTADNARREQQHQTRLERMRSSEADRVRTHEDRLRRIKESAGRRVSRIEEDAGIRRQRAEERARERIADQRRASLGRIGGELKGAVLGGAVAAGVLGAGVGGAAIKDAFALQSIANRISINSRKSGQDFIDPTTLRKQFEATAIATGGVVSAQEVAAGTQKFISKTGDIAAARKMMSTFATTSAATGTSFEDIASAAAELFKKFEINTPQAMGEALASITFGGKEGAFEISDAAQKYAKLASAGATFGMDKGVGGVRVLQGLSQIAMDSTGDRDVATTGVESMFRQIITESDNIRKKLGVDVFTDDTRTKAKDITKLLPEILAATEGDMTLLQDIFKDEGKRGINPLIDTFNRAYQGATGKGGKKATDKERVAAGKAAVIGQMSAAINAPGTFADLQMDADRAATGPVKLSQMWGKLTASMADKMVPAVTKLLDKIEASPGAIDAFVGTFEVLLEMMESFGRLFGIIDVDSQEYRRRQEEKRIRDADLQLSTLPSLEKAQSLAAAGKFDESKEMLAKLQDPSVKQRITALQASKAVSEARVARMDSIDRSAADVKTKDQFVERYLSLGKTDGLAINEASAREMAQKIAVMPMGEFSTKERLPGESEEQRQFRMGHVGSVAEEKIRAGGKADSAGAEVATKGLADAIKRLTSDMNQLSPAIRKAAESAQPSISTG